LTKLVLTRKSHVGHVTSDAWFSADALAQIIHNDEMKAGPLLSLGRPRAVVRKYPVKDFNEVEDAHLEPCLFAQLTRNALLERLPELQSPSRDGPFPAQGLATAADEHSAAIFDDHAANADDRTLGIFTGGGHFRNSAPERFTIQAAAPRIRVDLGQRGI